MQGSSKQEEMNKEKAVKRTDGGRGGKDDDADEDKPATIFWERGAFDKMDRGTGGQNLESGRDVVPTIPRIRRASPKRTGGGKKWKR